MVKRENIDSGYRDFQLDTRDSGSRRNLDYLLIRRTLSECKEDNPHMSQDVDKQRRDCRVGSGYSEVFASVRGRRANERRGAGAAL